MDNYDFNEPRIESAGNVTSVGLDLIRLAVRVAEVGGRPSLMWVNPETLERWRRLVARLEKRERRAMRMARKKRRGWA